MPIPPPPPILIYGYATGVGRRAMPIPPPPPLNRVFCPMDPAKDEAVRIACVSARSNLPGVFSSPLLTGPARGLGDVDPHATLYLICHGHVKLPLFTVDKKTWTPKAMANLLQTAGLRKDHRQIVMLVCHAGQTLGGRVAIAEREAIWKEWKKAKNPEKIKALDDKFRALKPEPEDFTNENQILPMVAQLMVHMKAKKYSNIRLRAFLGPVSTIFTSGIIEVFVDKIYTPVSERLTKDWL